MMKSLRQVFSIYYVVFGLFGITLDRESQRDYVSLEFDNIEAQLKQIKSPFRMSKALQSAINKYMQLEHIAKEVNNVFTLTVFITCVTNILCVSYVLNTFILTRKPFDQQLFLVDYCIAFAFCLKAMHSANRANAKKALLFRSFGHYVCGESAIPLQLTESRVRHLCWIAHTMTTDTDWFTLAWNIPIDVERILMILQNVFSVYQLLNMTLEPIHNVM